MQIAASQLESLYGQFNPSAATASKLFSMHTFTRPIERSLARNMQSSRVERYFPLPQPTSAITLPLSILRQIYDNEITREKQA
mmetsp:Transcript_2753/g.12335  ORF Transcript_2753/g.12335 Transcript_2753/m.12335 type:complete len:83 (-) Transcript_2753:1507-1755(-)